MLFLGRAEPQAWPWGLMYQSSLVGADAHQGFLIFPTYPLIKMDYQLCRRPLSLSLWKIHSVLHIIYQGDCQAPPSLGICLVSPTTSRSNPEGAAAIGNHLFVAILMCLNDVYL